MWNDKKLLNEMSKEKGINMKIRKRSKRFLVYLGLVVFLAGSNVEMKAFATQEMPEAGTEETTEQASKKEGKIITQKGNKYYENANGKRVKKQFVTVGKKTYYFGTTGAMEKGWIKKGKDYYYLDRQTGVQKKNCTVDGVKIDKSGKAKKDTYSKKKIETMITAKKIVDKQTAAGDNKEKKLEKAFKWVMKHPYKRHHIFDKERKTKGWEMLFANDEFGKAKSGCCVSEACAFAFLAHECGYPKVYICDDTGHAWVEINGKVYDTLFAEAKSYSKYYGSSYKTASLHCVNKLKI